MHAYRIKIEYFVYSKSRNIEWSCCFLNDYLRFTFQKKFSCCGCICFLDYIFSLVFAENQLNPGLLGIADIGDIRWMRPVYTGRPHPHRERRPPCTQEKKDSYPCGNFYVIFWKKTPWSKGSIGSDFSVCHKLQYFQPYYMIIWKFDEAASTNLFFHHI
jgi:hypothetical protein